MAKKFNNVGDLIGEIESDMEELASGIAERSELAMHQMVSDAYNYISMPLKVGDVEVSKLKPGEFKEIIESNVFDKSASVGMPSGVITISDGKVTDIAKDAKKHEILSKKMGPFKRVFTRLSTIGILGTFLKSIGMTTNFKLKRK